jgi:phosphoribosylamine--glycine ligase
VAKKILVVGGGGREHALCWAIARSAQCGTLYCAPGNAGIASVAECVGLGDDDIPAIVEFAKKNAIDLVVVGPEAPLVAGLVDELADAGIAAFGPSAAAAALEGSKGFMKDLCARYDIPTADYARFDEPGAAIAHILEKSAPIVVKADGLAAGKGVIICQSRDQAIAAIDRLMSERAFGEAGAEIVIEEFLNGEEASFFALVDGTDAVPLVSAQDHKAAFDGDRGPNTGGMGAYSPAPVVSADMEIEIMDRIIRPTIDAMAKEGRPYRGVLYAGLMIDAEGPKLLEYNVRFGDPECQVLMMRLKSDLVEALSAAAEGRLGEVTLEWNDDAAIVVVMAANGYPGNYRKGTEIKGLDAAGAVAGVTVFHAGTKADGARMLSNGGRVLGVTARAPSVAEARARAYEAVDAIDWPDGFYRRDIAWRALERN